MTDEQWLRDELASAVPEPPSRPDRARAAQDRARHRRRTTSLAVLGTSGVVVAAAVLAAALSSGTGDGPAPADIAPDAGPVVECPSIEVDDGIGEGSAIDEPDPEAPGSVPEGATSARLCQGPGSTIEVPAEALLTDVDALAAAVNDLPTAEEPEMCTLDLGPGFRIAFGYPDGSTFVVSGKLYGCRTLVVGNGYRADPETAQEEFRALLRAQRDASAEPSDPGQATQEDGVVTCPDAPALDYDGIDAAQPGLPDAVPSGATSVRLCAGGGSGTGLEPADALTTDVAALVDAVNALPGLGAGGCTDDLGPGYRLAFGYPDGSRFVVVGRFYGCQDVVVGSDYRVDPQTPLDTFVGLLQAQREGSLPGAVISDPDDLDCGLGPHPTQALADPADVVLAKLCIGDAEVVVPEEDLSALVEDLRTHQGTATTGACRAIPTRIVGVTRWGDLFSLFSECGTTSYELPGGAGYWNPSREVRRLLDSYAGAD